MIKHIIILTMIGISCGISDLAWSESVLLPAGVMEKLQNLPASEKRQPTLIPESGSGAGIVVNGKDLDKSRSVDELLEQYQFSKSAEAFSPSSAGISVNPSNDKHLVEERVQSIKGDLKDRDIEYIDDHRNNGVLHIVSIKLKDGIAANAFTSGSKPVSLTIDKANLVATQRAGKNLDLPVTVRVGNIKQVIKVGDVGHFGNFDVNILASSNNSNNPNREGPAYALRLQVLPAN